LAELELGGPTGSLGSRELGFDPGDAPCRGQTPVIGRLNLGANLGASRSRIRAVLDSDSDTGCIRLRLEYAAYTTPTRRDGDVG